ncbi:substrate-binding domain-containing protein [Burkholderia cepacia]|uniref:substrate-binding domain-containing protein n=1 Tax=Burkholderia cepacia TaxID=292 RepID=UPI003AF36B09
MSQARRVLNEADRLIREVARLNINEMGNLTIGIGPYCAEILLPELLIEFTNRYPKVNLRIEHGDDQLLVEQLLVGGVDLIVSDRRGLPSTPIVATHLLSQHEVTLYVRPGHPLLSLERIVSMDLHGYPFVSTPIPRFLRETIHQMLKLRNDEEFFLRTQCSDISVLMGVVNNTDSIMFSTVSAAREETTKGTLMPIRPVDVQSMPLEFGLAHLTDHSLTPVVEATVMMIRGAMQT